MGNSIGLYESKKEFGKIRLATAKETNFFLSDAEKFDNYINKINISIHNTTSRIGMYYESLVPDISESQREQIYKWISEFSKKNEKWLILTDLVTNLGDIWILPLSYSADGGMPHTRGIKYICVPGSFFEVDHGNSITLKHELIHLHQKMDKLKWNKIYKIWDWEMWEGRLPEKYEAIRRINPDTEWGDGPLYVLKKLWVPFCVFREVDRPNVRNTIVWYYNVKSGMVWKSTGILDLPPEIGEDPAWNDVRINMAMREHPHEMSAWFLASPEKYVECTLLNLMLSSIRNWPKNSL